MTQNSMEFGLSKAQMEFVKSDNSKVLFNGGLGSGKCLKAGSLVKTPNGSVKIEDLRPGDEVYGYNADNTISICKVTALHDQGVKEIVDLSAFNEVLTSCTMDHRVLAYSKKHGKVLRRVKRIKDFNKRDEQLATFNVDIPGGNKVVPEAYGLGVMIGDGSCREGGLVVSSENEDVIKKTQISLGLVGYNKCKSNNFSWKLLNDGKSYDNEYYNKWCNNRYAHEKIIDLDEVRKWDRKSQIELLSGLIDSDGSVYMSNRLNLQLGMQSKVVIEVAQALILDLFQVQTTLYKDDREKYVNGPVWYIRVSINSLVKKILKELNTVVESKQYKDEYDDLVDRVYKGDAIGFTISEPYIAQTYDITIDNDTHLYMLSNGIITHNTFAGAAWAVLMTQKYPKCKGVITANTYTQLKGATLDTFFKVIEIFGYKYKYNKQESIIYIEGGSEIHARSMEKYDALRGIEYGWAWSDECAFYKKEAFDVLIGRIRDAHGPCQWKGTTTPNGFNWLYTAFVESPLRNSQVIKCKTTDNLANLGGDYFETLSDQYDAKLAQQELEGEFVNLTSGLVYYTFDRRKHLKEFNGDRSSIIIGLDFNVNPLCATYLCIDKAGTMFVVDESFLLNSNTFQAAKEIINKYPVENKLVIADETGNRRKTSAEVGRTDHKILRDSGLILPPFKNPQVKDRYNNINRLLERGYLYISPKCVKLIGDLEKLSYDNKDDMLSHISDALGYACWYINPLRKPRNEAKITLR